MAVHVSTPANMPLLLGAGVVPAGSRAVLPARRAVVMAHFHPQGAVPPHTARLLQCLSSLTDRVVLVSTRLADDARAALAPGIEVIVRENSGYDFCSYQRGIRALGDLSDWDELIIANDSIYLLFPERLAGVIATMRQADVDLWGLTASHQQQTHLQSYFVAFNRPALQGETFARFWDSVEVLHEKREIVRRYEVGLTAHFLAAGCRVGVALEPTARDRVRMAWLRAHRKPLRFLARLVRMAVNPAYGAQNPTHFLWERVLDTLGFIKVDLVRSNEKNIGLNDLPRHLSAGQHQELQQAAQSLRAATAVAEKPGA